MLVLHLFYPNHHLHHLAAADKGLLANHQLAFWQRLHLRISAGKKKGRYRQQSQCLFTRLLCVITALHLQSLDAQIPFLRLHFANAQSSAILLVRRRGRGLEGTAPPFLPGL